MINRVVPFLTQKWKLPIPTMREALILQSGLPSPLNSPVCASFLSPTTTFTQREPRHTPAGARPWRTPITCLRITGVHVETDGWPLKNSHGVKQRGTETKKTGTDRVTAAVWSLGSSVQVSWAVGSQTQLTSPTWGNGERTQQSLTS